MKHQSCLSLKHTVSEKPEAIKSSVHKKVTSQLVWLYELLINVASHQNWEKSLHLASSRARYRARHVFLWKIASRFSLAVCLQHKDAKLKANATGSVLCQVHVDQTLY